MRGIAAIPGSSTPQLVDLPEPDAPGPGQVLCRTLELGVCGTDREILASEHPLVPPGELQLVLGHECLGRVEEVGPRVTDLAVGDLVVPVVRRATVKSHTRVDLLPFGQYTERGIVHEHGFSLPRWLDRPEHLFIVPPSLRAFAVLTEPLTVAEKGIHEALAVQQGRLGPDAWTETPPRVLVTGLGPIALAAVLGTVCRGWPTTVFGRDSAEKFRAWLVTALGARYLSAPEADFAPADVEADGYDLILECTGSENVLVAAAQALAARGVMVWLGSSRRPQPRMLNVAQMLRDAVLRNHIHVGSVNAAPRDFESALEHLNWWRQRNARALSSLITARVNQQEALWHYEHRAPQGIKTVIEYG